MSNAVIVNDPQLCPCCGGLVINFKDKPTFIGDGVYGIINQTDLAIDYKELPLYVRVNWATESNACRPTARITKLEKR